jgi:LacI family transcriptional regulator
MSTIIEVAKLAGVSTATVSNVIRSTRVVSSRRTERVRAAIKQLNYSPNEIARSLKVRQTRILAMVLPDITNPFFPELIRGAEDAAFARGYFLVTANTDEQVGRERRIIEAFRSYRVGGILLATAQGRKGPDADHISALIQGGMPVVCLDRTVPNVKTDAVLLDNTGGARECVRHLIKQGYSSIAMVSGPAHLQTAHERFEGYRLALEDAGIPVQQSLIIRGDFRFESGYQAVIKLLKLKKRPDAIFVANGVMAQGALKAIDTLELRCPEDLALATFDHLASEYSHQPELTSVVQPSYDMGSRAGGMLMDRIEGRLQGGYSVIRVAPTLIVRVSSVAKRNVNG